MLEVPDFLPLGSVVRLKGSTKKLVLISRAVVVKDDMNDDEYYDYGFAFYPDGLSGEAVIYSNHDCIEEILFQGFSDEDDETMVNTLKTVIPKLSVRKSNPQPISVW